MEQAVTRVVRVPALHEAMVAGVLDDYKARRLAGELGDVPPDLARAVVDALAGGLSSMSGPALQRRARTMLMSLCPDLLRERIRKGRKRVGLRRWMGEPGTDSWGGSFPSERAARAWAAIDALARRYRLEGRHDTLEQARAYALMDLVDGNATVETVLHLSVPVEGLDAATRAARAAGGFEDPDAEVEAEAEAEGEARRRADDRECMEDCAGGGGRCVVSAHGRAGVGDHGDVAGASGGASFFRPRLSKTVGMDTSGDAVFVGVAGAQGRSISWLPVSALMSCTRDAGSAAVVCHRWTGALLDPADRLATQAYRPGEALKTHIRRRDGGCRFPGCSVSARQCDLDHVVPWPHGPTSAAKLICLCRRHHRVKQRHRWRLRLFADGGVEWVDPTGRRHRTEPVDHPGATPLRVIDTGTVDADLLDVAARDIDDRDIDVGDTDDRDIDDGDDAGAATQDLSSSRLERWLDLSVDHATAQPSAQQRREPAMGGGRGRYPTAVSGEEIDQLSRVVRAGTFASIDDAIHSRSHSTAARAGATPPRGERGCRVDHHFAVGGHAVTIRLLRRHRHRHRTEPAPAVEIPPPF